MIRQRKGEERIDYLARVLYWVAHNTIAGEQTVEFDEAECDVHCLAEDICDELGLDTDEF